MLAELRLNIGLPYSNQGVSRGGALSPKERAGQTGFVSFSIVFSVDRAVQMMSGKPIGWGAGKCSRTGQEV